MNKKRAQAEETKQHILSAAKELFARKGYTATSLEELAAATGSSKANIYYHFKSKEGLFLQLMDEHDCEWKAHWAKQKSRYRTYAEQMYGMTEEGIKAGFHHPLHKAAGEFLGETKGKNSYVTEQINKKTEENRAYYRDFFQKGIDSGEFKNLAPHQMALTMESLFRGLSEIALNMDYEEAQKLFRDSIAIILHGIAADSSS
ncbi:TetR/AcrR family transcriptional regulator [Paenibacillus sp. J5C_2022]|uniref:TetR/AcrR family transcriptional regulator n=1 Tax=Paenibacillus sp. J5C2022 TaxID=2977129 RepID=UPI0021D1F1D0|nr:TetR/AcrR family transcriptional regulator [Paenibacillus sp. J5C2022]MCU6708470.1 TetR/AcrR family transcriptional regulator [Paenibacillus sp. J5C2022]